MWVLTLGLALFFGTHLISALPRKRHKLIRQFGEQKFKLGYSIGAGVGLLLIIVGYGLARDTATNFYDPPYVLRTLAMALIAISFLLFIAANMKGYIKWYVRHPMIAGVKLWAFGHLLVNGDAASVLLFGGFLVWAVFDRISVAKREKIGMIKTRDFDPNILHDVAAIGIALLLSWAFAAYLHSWLIGVPLL